MNIVLATKDRQRVVWADYKEEEIGFRLAWCPRQYKTMKKVNSIKIRDSIGWIMILEVFKN